jgi:hypothetical protein
MSDKERKKDGQDTGKKRKRMREAVAERQQKASPARPSHDRQDTVPYKNGSAGDRGQKPENKHAGR